MSSLTHKTMIKMINNWLTPKEKVTMSAHFSNKSLQISVDRTNIIRDFLNEQKGKRYAKLALICRGNITSTSKNFKDYSNHLHL